MVMEKRLWEETSRPNLGNVRWWIKRIWYSRRINKGTRNISWVVFFTSRSISTVKWQKMIYMIQQLMTYCNREECFGIICIIYISQLRKVDCTVLVINLCKKFTNTLDNPSLNWPEGRESRLQRVRRSATVWRSFIQICAISNIIPYSVWDWGILTVGRHHLGKRRQRLI